MGEITQSGIKQAAKFTSMADKIMLARFKEKYYKQALDILEGIPEEDSEAAEKDEVLKMKESVALKLNDARACKVIEKYNFALKSREYARLSEDLGSAAQHFEDAAAEMEKVPVDVQKLDEAQQQRYLEVKKAKTAAEECRKKSSTKFQLARVRVCGLGLLVIALAAGFWYGKNTPVFRTVLGRAEMTLGMNKEAAASFKKAYTANNNEETYALYLDAAKKTGMNLFDKGDYSSACSYLHVAAMAGDAEAAETVTNAEIQILEAAEIEDVVVFGGMKWRVLDKNDSECLLTKFEATFGMPYQENPEEGQKWSESSLRTYLNGEFLTETFNSFEIAQIEETQVSGDDNPVYETDGGEDTTDRLYLLSCQEYEQYKDVINECGHCIWLRTPGAEEGSAAFVDVEQTVMYYGYETGSDAFYVKPVMWVSLSE